jgi:glycogen debranching enzyme
MAGDFTRVTVPPNRLAERILNANVRYFASFPLAEGGRDEWLTLQALMPLYPALFGRDTLTAGWQAAYLDRGASLDASLTRLGRMQSDRVNDWRDEEPGRIPYQVRRRPLALLDLNPYPAYYADFASPLMFVISLAHLYPWTGEMSIQRHWDVARRILDWARTDGDKDRDGYLEYQTRSTRGTKNQGGKDSGDAIVYDDGTPVPSPIGTCELQGYSPSWWKHVRVASLCAHGHRVPRPCLINNPAAGRGRVNRLASTHIGHLPADDGGTRLAVWKSSRARVILHTAVDKLSRNDRTQRAICWSP